MFLRVNLTFLGGLSLLFIRGKMPSKQPEFKQVWDGNGNVHIMDIVG